MFVRQEESVRRRETLVETGSEVGRAVDAVERARGVLRVSGDPLMAAVDSALTCAVSLIELRHRGTECDIDTLHNALDAARALVGEVTFAVRDSYPGAGA
ncbi:hypothetical protein [Amycolatopsis decaplanina]|uniref:Uncharacterized protein n=1 Tax=Amycolatopsis decaplanina DSM 44594 TaxID=1284240 RepID=M2WUS2_9PSEU|nr:hypothetical protein [Amycolatopsis decaplanina]EME52511.1 hypothetical protein H074_33429 [Amycolatopsis decaplanina DSM 44594]